MPKFKHVDKLTFGADGSIILVPQKQRESYFKNKFGLTKPEISSFRKTKKMELEDDINDPTMTGNEKYTPKASDLVRVPFRALSATVVAAGTWRATDFTNEEVLRRSLAKIIGKSAFVQHWQYTDECIGAIEKASWSERTVQGGGRIVPAGIDIVYLINGEHNEKLCSNLLMEPPGIYSNSVTVEFAWEPSHDDIDEDQFYNMIGQVHADKRMVSRKVTEIIDYHEASICWLGADPYAKMKDDKGNLINPEEGAVYDNVNSFVKELYQKDRHFFASYSFKKENIYLTPEKLNNQTDMEKALLDLVRKILGLAADAEVTQAHIDSVVVAKKEEHDAAVTALSKMSKFAQMESEITALKASDKSVEITGLKNEIETFKNKVAELEPFSVIGKAHFDAKKAETIRLYKLSLNGAAEDATMIANFEKADSKGLDSFLTMFTKGVKEKFEAKCKKCGITEVEFRSTFVEGEDTPPKNEGQKHLGMTFRGA